MAMQDAAVHVHSAAAKPRILRALLGVLSDARLASGADCATAEAAVRHHNLLCETFDEGSNAAAHHAAAVDVYLEHLESLAVPHASEHAKMAACRLLEQACLECGPRRFVASLGRWGAALGKLADGADRDGNPTPSARAALRALAAMTRRASAMMDVPGVRKEAATVAQKTAAAALRRIESRESSAVFPSDDAVDAVDAIAVCLESHPAALRPKTDAVEAALVKVVLESPHGTNSTILSRATRALARLPRTGAFAFESASGIADPSKAFAAQTRRVLIALHDELDHGLRGMESTSNAFAKQARSALVPAGAAAPPPLGGGAEKMIKGEKESSRQETRLDRATRLFGLLAEQLRAPFPSAQGVPVAADLVLGAVRRALAADGAGVAVAPGLPATAAPAEALAALPAAHVAACDALAALLEAGGGACVRLAGPVARALDGVLRAGAGGGTNSDAYRGRRTGNGDGVSKPSTCASIRAAAYRAAAAAARALGPASAAGELALFVVPHAARDAVFGWGSGGDESSPASGTAARGVDAKTKMSKSRKKGAGGAWGRAGADEMDAYLAAGGLMDRRGGLAGGGLGHNADFVREAALDALEAIVTSGGAMLPANVRTLADAAAAEAASKAVLAATAGYGSGTTQSLESRSPMAVRARRAAYALLLASTLAPRPFRATNLPLAASVFRAARVRDAALSAECARAALAVEALLHPAAPPLHPRAIAPPRGDMNGGVSDGMYETGAFGNDGFGGASWGGDDSVAQKRAPAWGDAARERLEESEEEEEESEEEEEERREEKGVADDAAVSRGAPGPPSGASSEPNEPTKREASPPASPRGAKKAKAEAEKDEAEGVPDAPSGRASRSRAASARQNAPAASAPEPKPKPKRQTAKEKAAAAKAAKAAKAEAEAAAKAAAATSNPKPVGLGLGSGKSSVALELSDSDSDGELPEIVDE